jgi:signal transduction histidine kinase
MTIAEIIDARKDEILETWLEKLKVNIPEVNNHDRSAVENSVPNLIVAIINVLETGDVQKVSEHSHKHALERADFKVYTLKHIIKEYNLLKKEIFHVIDQHSGINPGERDSIMFVVDEAIEEAAETFYRIKQGVQINARNLAEQKANEMELQDENREDFISSISHDLNTPLNNIKGCINLLENDLEVDQVNKLLRILKGSTYQAELLIRDFLDVNMVNPDAKLPVKRELVNIVEELENEVTIFKIAQGVNIELILKENEIFVEVDINLLRRALNNLINNAVRHGDRLSDIKVLCRLEDNLLVISVHNKGRIIPSNVLEAIFNRYYKINDSGAGWGIGLAFVKEVAEAHGGEVNVESIENDGTTFQLKIPVK